MGFPMTVERVIARNHIEGYNAQDDIRRLAEDSATLARADLAARLAHVLHEDGWADGKLDAHEADEATCRSCAAIREEAER